MKKLLFVVLALTLAGAGQAPSHKPTARAGAKRSATVRPSGVDQVIALVKGGMSESLIIKTLQKQGTTYALLPADLLKLQKAGVPENIISVMMDPKASLTDSTTASSEVPSESSAGKDPTPAGAAPAPAAPPPPDKPVATPYPPDLNIGKPTELKRRVVVVAFDFGAIKEQIQAIYSPWSLLHPNSGAAVANQDVTDEIGQGIRAMLMSRLQQANVVTVLDRNPAIEREQQQGVTAQNSPATRPKMGRILGADCIVTGDITIFGRDDKTNKKGGGGILVPKWKGVGGGVFGRKAKEDKAVVAIEYRVVDAETSAVLAAGSARGESIRKSKELNFGGLGIGSGGAAGGGFSSGTGNSNFEKTILGEATVDAVDKIVKQLGEKIPQLPAKPRSIEGRVASITPEGVYLAVGANDGVMLGDRFAILQITGEVSDPQTKEVIDIQAEKVGELVVNNVREKASLGNYGGQPLSPEYITGKGYLARLMSK